MSNRDNLRMDELDINIDKSIERLRSMDNSSIANELLPDAIKTLAWMVLPYAVSGYVNVVEHPSYSYYDYSGELVRRPLVDVLDECIADGGGLKALFDIIRTGERRATYVSRMGFSHPSVYDAFCSELASVVRDRVYSEALDGFNDAECDILMDALDHEMFEYEEKLLSQVISRVESNLDNHITVAAFVAPFLDAYNEKLQAEALIRAERNACINDINARVSSIGYSGPKYLGGNAMPDYRRYLTDYASSIRPILVRKDLKYIENISFPFSMSNRAREILVSTIKKLMH